MAPKRAVIFAAFFFFVGVFLGCGGGGEKSPIAPPKPDFTFVVNPPTLLVAVGAASPPAVISVTSENNFSGSVSVAITGLPDGVTPSPQSPISIAAGASREITFFASSSQIFGDIPIQLTATSGELSKSDSLTLKLLPPPTVRTYQDGAKLFLEAAVGSEVTRVGLLTSWGGTIVEASLNGTNYVNSNDPGRQVQVSLWDGDADYVNSWGYNPVQAGDRDFDGSPVLEQTISPDSIYIKTQPIQWAPESFGGSTGNPVLGDAYVEQWLTPVPNRGRAFKVHYKITHFGTDTHTNAFQELPVVYVNRGFDTFIYSDAAPWSYGTVTHYTMPALPGRSPNLYAPEHWGAYVDSSDSGLTAFVPSSYPYVSGFVFDAGPLEGTNNFGTFAVFTWYPGAVFEGDIYLIVGPVADARPVIYELRHEDTGPSRLPPFGILDEPVSGAAISGNAVQVGGWLIGTSPIAKVDVLVDGSFVGSATYGLSRPDLPQALPGQSEDVGFDYLLDSTTLANGAHNLSVKATDENGNIAIFPTCHLDVTNP
jgi:hypothetical protein